MNLSQKIIEKAKKIKLILTDVDGVLTDGTIYFSSAEGELFKTFHARDGQAILLMPKYGVKCGFITGGNSKSIKERAKMLNIDIAYFGTLEKMKCLQEIMTTYNLQPEQIAYCGDDVPDIPVLEHVGLSFCPSDSPYYIQDLVDHVTTVPGGKGVFREMAEIILIGQNKINNLIDEFK